VRRMRKMMMFSNFGVAPRINDAASQRELMQFNVDDIKDVRLRNLPLDQVPSCRTHGRST
jgi:hypothetical protein